MCMTGDKYSWACSVGDMYKKKRVIPILQDRREWYLFFGFQFSMLLPCTKACRFQWRTQDARRSWCFPFLLKTFNEAAACYKQSRDLCCSIFPNLWCLNPKLHRTGIKNLIDWAASRGTELLHGMLICCIWNWSASYETELLYLKMSSFMWNWAASRKGSVSDVQERKRAKNMADTALLHGYVQCLTLDELWRDSMHQDRGTGGRVCAAPLKSEIQNVNFFS